MGGDEIIGIPRILHSFPCQFLLNPRPKEKYYEFSQFNYEKIFPQVPQEIHKCTKLGKVRGQTSECKAGKKVTVTMNTSSFKASCFL